MAEFWQRDSRKPPDRSLEILMLIKSLITWLSSIMLGLALITLGLTVWLRQSTGLLPDLFDSTSLTWNVLGDRPSSTVLSALSASAVVLGGSAIAGLFAVFRKSATMLIFYNAVLILLIVMDGCLLLLIAWLRQEAQLVLKDYLVKKLFNVSTAAHVDAALRKRWSDVERRNSCCGIDNFSDYSKHVYSSKQQFPASCCRSPKSAANSVENFSECFSEFLGEKQVSKVLHTDGCKLALLADVDPWLLWTFSLMSLSIVLQAVMLVLSCVFLDKMRKKNIRTELCNCYEEEYFD